jgi:hypothetical protein
MLPSRPQRRRHPDARCGADILYTPNVADEPAPVVRRNLWEVVSLLFPDRVVGYRTAIEGKPSPEGTVNLVGGYDRLLELPGLTIRQIEGPGPLEGDTRFIGTLWLASRPRALLECLRPSRPTSTPRPSSTS